MAHGTGGGIGKRRSSLGARCWSAEVDRRWRFGKKIVAMRKDKTGGRESGPTSVTRRAMEEDGTHSIPRGRNSVSHFKCILKATPSLVSLLL